MANASTVSRQLRRDGYAGVRLLEQRLRRVKRDTQPVTIGGATYGRLTTSSSRTIRTLESTRNTLERARERALTAETGAPC